MNIAAIALGFVFSLVALTVSWLGYLTFDTLRRDKVRKDIDRKTRNFDGYFWSHWYFECRSTYSSLVPARYPRCIVAGCIIEKKWLPEIHHGAGLSVLDVDCEAERCPQCALLMLWIEAHGLNENDPASFYAAKRALE